MTVEELIERLRECPPKAEVKLNADLALEDPHCDANAGTVVLSASHGRWFARKTLGIKEQR
jgi:hypothetical protein